ncbi:RIP metalloprotease RseP [Zhaonella formicivorans]|uniref:RIP metalloprotease RseP n=1 Tax=Zhaonella formicivorans TaxID=2528593 RepID=UPI001D11ED96|nr:RIP metalloprotease RseP [Zhaonella formicivorans]
MSVLITILILGVLIIAHELGHLLAAKAVGIKVHEFAIGMGPKIIGYQAKETLYSLRAFPIGGFNRMAGMEPGDEDDVRGFNTKSVGQRSLVIAAGSLMNFILALTLFIIVFMGIGIPSNQNVVGRVVPGGAAELAGLQAGDRIIAINGEKTASWDELTAIIHKNPERKIEITVLRENKKMAFAVTPRLDPKHKVGLIGIERAWEKQGFLNSIMLGVKQAVGVSILLVTSLVQMIIGKIPADVAGPVGMVQLVGQAVEFGLASVLNFAAILSLNLGLINLFPIPALDGSRLIFLGLEKLRGQPLQPDKENFIHFVGFFLLIALMLLITYQDIVRLILK